MSINSIAKVLFEDYCHWRQQTKSYHGLAYRRSPRWDKERESLLTDLHEWCQKNGLETRLWLYVLFVRRWWRCPPRWDQLIPKGEAAITKNMARYYDLESHERLAYQVYVIGTRQNDEMSFNSRVDLSHSVEAQKTRYLERGLSRLCIEEIDRTLGFHPGSKVCCQCDQKATCIQALVRRFGPTVVQDRQGVTKNGTTSHRRYGGEVHKSSI